MFGKCTNVCQCLNNVCWTRRRSCRQVTLELSSTVYMPASPYGMTSFYSTAARLRMRIRPPVRRKKNPPQTSRTGAAAVCPHHEARERGREKEGGLNGEQHHRLFHPASPPTSTELQWKHASTLRLSSAVQSSPSSSSKCPWAVTLGTL